MPPSEEELEEFNKQFELLIENELIEIVSINDDGEWLYQATEKGKKLYEAVMNAGLIGDKNWLFGGEND